MRIAIALLLQHPELYKKAVECFDINGESEKEYHILMKLILQLKNNPQANTAALIESWRTSDYFEAINKLAAWEHQVPEAELDREFTDILLFLQKKNHEVTIHQLIAKARLQGLSAAERLSLQEMLKNRHQHLINEK